MIPSFLITFREALEVSLIVGIVLSYLIRTKQAQYTGIVHLGVAAGIIASILGAFVFTALYGGFSGTAEAVFEGVTMLFGAMLLTTMILWMMNQRHIAHDLENKVSHEVSESHKAGLFMLVFFSVLREGIETVIFLGAASFATGGPNFIGAFLGIVAAIVLGYLIFVGSMRIDIKKFFKITSILLILFAAGLVAHGVHELEEASIFPPIIEHVWDLNPLVGPDGNYHPLHENGDIGSFMKGLFGYNGNPSLLEALSYAAYIGIVFVLWRRIDKKYR